MPDDNGDDQSLPALNNSWMSALGVQGPPAPEAPPPPLNDSWQKALQRYRTPFVIQPPPQMPMSQPSPVATVATQGQPTPSPGPTNFLGGSTADEIPSAPLTAQQSAAILQQGMQNQPPPGEAKPQVPDEVMARQHEELDKWRKAIPKKTAWETFSQNAPVLKADVDLVSDAVKMYGAMRRFDAGQAGPGDYYDIAKWEKRIQAEKDNPWAAGLGSTHNFLGTLLLTGGASMAGAGGEQAAKEGAKQSIKEWLTGLATKEGALQATKALGKRTAVAAATQAALPQTWSNWMKANVSAGNHPLDLETLPAEMARNTAQMAVLGSLDKITGGQASKGLLPAAKRLAIGVAGGMVEQQAADAAIGTVDKWLPKSMQANAGYGVVGQLAQGQYGDAARAATMQVLQFGAVKGFHEIGRASSAVQDYADNLAARQAKGEPIETAAPAAAKEVTQAPEKAPEAPPAEPAKTAPEGTEKYPPGYFEPGGGGHKDAFDVNSLETKTAPPSPPGAEGSGSSPMTPEQAGAALDAEKARVATLPPNARDAGIGQAAPEEAGTPEAPAGQIQSWNHTGTQFRPPEPGREGAQFTAADGKDYDLTARAPSAEWKGKPFAEITVHDAEGNEVGRVKFDKNEDPTGKTISAGDVLISAKHLQGTEAELQKKGYTPAAAKKIVDTRRSIVNGMYDFMHEEASQPGHDMSGTVVPSKTQSKGGKAIWDRNAALATVATPPTLESLRQRYEAGKDVTPDELHTAAGHTPIERHILTERTVNGRSFQDIANDPEAVNPKTGQPYTRQRLKQFEQSAMDKLGSVQSVASSVFADEIARNRQKLLDQGWLVARKNVEPGALSATREVARRKEKVEGWVREHEAKVAEFLKEHANESKSLSRRGAAEGGEPSAEPGAEPGQAGEPASARPPAGAGIPPVEFENPQAGVVEPAAEGGGGGPAAAATPEGASDQLNTVRDVFSRSFPGATGDPAAGMEAEFAGRPVRIRMTAAGAVDLQFGEGEDISSGLSAGALQLGRKLNSFVKELGSKGVPISFDAEPRRARAYRNLLEKAGYGMTSSVPNEAEETYRETWAPKPATGKVDAVDASRAALVKYGFSESDVRDFEKQARSGRSLHSITEGLERGNDPNNPEIGNEQQMMQDHLRKVLAQGEEPPTEELKAEEAARAAKRAETARVKALSPNDRAAEVRHKDVFDTARQLGISPNDVHKTAKDAFEADKAGAEEHNEYLRAARAELKKYKVTPLRISQTARNGGDVAMLPGMDVAADAFFSDRPDLLRPDENPADGLARILTDGNRQPGTLADHYEALKQEMIDRKAAAHATEPQEAALAEAARRQGISPSVVAEALRNGQEDGLSESAEGETGAPGEGEAARAETGDTSFDFGQPGGPAGEQPGGPGEQPAGGGAGEPGGPGAGARRAGVAAERVETDRLHAAAMELARQEAGTVDLTVLGRIADRTTSYIRSAWDGIRKLAGEMYPRAHDLNREAGERMVNYVSAPGYARAASVRMIEKVMGRDATPADRKYFGDVVTERRLRYMRDAYDRQLQTAQSRLDDALDRQFTAKTPDDRAAATADAEKASRDISEARKARDGVKTIVGGDNSSLKDDAAYQAALADPRVQQVIANHDKYMAPVMEQNFRTAQGLDDNDPINSFTQIPGSPVNLKPMGPDEPDTPTTVKVATLPRGNLKNLKLGRLIFARQATGSAERYDTDLGAMIENSLSNGYRSAAKHEMYRALTESGLAKFGRRGQSVDIGEQKGIELPNVDPPAGTQDAVRGDSSLYLHPDVYQEVREALGVDKANKLGALTDGLNLLGKANLISTAEATYHAANNLTFLSKAVANPFRFAKNLYDVITNNPETADRFTELARQGATKEFHRAAPGSLADSRWWLPSWPSRFLGAVDKAMRLTADQQFTAMTKMKSWQDGSPLVPDTEENRRNFINQLGQYNRAAQNKVVQLARDTGLGPFATAGTNYFMQGLRALTMNPGVKVNSWEGAVRLRSGQLARYAALTGTVAALNYAMWGRADGDDDTPLLAIKVGKSVDGKTMYLDPLGWMTPLKRGLREVGALAFGESQRKGLTLTQSGDKAFNQAAGALAHPLVGPGGQFVWTAATGQSTGGWKLARDISTAKTPAQYQRDMAAGKAPPGSSETAEKFRAAALNLNPFVGTLTGANRPRDVPTEQHWWELAGPLGLREAGQGNKPRKSFRRTQ